MAGMNKTIEHFFFSIPDFLSLSFSISVGLFVFLPFVLLLFFIVVVTKEVFSIPLRPPNPIPFIFIFPDCALQLLFGFRTMGSSACVTSFVVLFRILLLLLPPSF